MIRQGEVYMADFEVGGPHPVIVVSRESLNRGRYALVVVCTSARFPIRKLLPDCVPLLTGQFGMTVDRVAQCENLLSIERSQIISGVLGTLDEMTLRDVIKAVGYVIESDCEPD